MSALRARRRDSGEDLEPVLEAMRERAGLVIPVRTAPFDAVRREMHRLGVTHAAEYARLVGSDDRAFDALITALTVGETYFFREREQLEFIAREVIPGVAREAGRPTLTAWSAGCANGEEAYSLAALAETAGFPLRVLGTDISRLRLQRARLAVYGEWSFRGVPHETRAKFFRKTKQGFEVLPSIRSRVEFGVLNLASTDWSVAEVKGPFDLILCRNTLIYLDGPTVARVARRLMASLTPSGWLFLGASDPLLSGTVPCEVVLTGSGIAYRRPHRARRARVPDRTPAPHPPTPRSAPPVRERRRAVVPAMDKGKSSPPSSAAGNDSQRLYALYAQADYGAAAELARRIVAREPGGVSAWIILVRALANLGRLEEAGNACAAAHDRHRNSAELAYLHGLLLREAGRIEDAAAALRSAIYLDRELAIAHLTLGDVLAAHGDMRSARRAFRNAYNLVSGLRSDDVVPATDGLFAGTLTSVTRGRMDYWQKWEQSPEAAGG